MVLPESDAESARVTCEQDRTVHLSRGDEPPQVVVSVGITSYPADGDTAEILLNVTADEKLYDQQSLPGEPDSHRVSTIPLLIPWQGAVCTPSIQQIMLHNRTGPLPKTWNARVRGRE